jgi:predicted Rossmann fold flavoprotein
MYDAIIIGGGAAGLFAAITAGKRGRRVLVIEHNAEVGRKIIISGGGRCNFTNLHTRPENFISQNRHFCKSALAGYSANDFVELVRSHKIPYYEKKLGQLFCRESSRQIVTMLLDECRRAKVKIATGCSVSDVTLTGERTFLVDSSHGRVTARNLVVATGGLSFAKIGATDFGFRIARRFGLKVTQTRPSLVAMIVAGEKWPNLAGIAIDAVVRSGKVAFRENILFTHRGLSGPAILQISNYWSAGGPVFVDLLPEEEIADLNGQELFALIERSLPERAAAFLAKRPGNGKSAADLSKAEIDVIAKRMKRWEVSFKETEGYDRAEVTLGGVSTTDLDSKTMESRHVKGLFFIGEVVDVTGWLGGYNFQWAWASGFAAGNAI